MVRAAVGAIRSSDADESKEPAEVLRDACTCAVCACAFWKRGRPWLQRAYDTCGAVVCLVDSRKATRDAVNAWEREPGRTFEQVAVMWLVYATDCLERLAERQREEGVAPSEMATSLAIATMLRYPKAWIDVDECEMRDAMLRRFEDVVREVERDLLPSKLCEYASPHRARMPPASATV